MKQLTDKRKILIKDQYEEHKSVGSKNSNLWLSIIILSFLCTASLTCFFIFFGFDWSNLLRTLAFFTPLFIAFIVSSLRHITKVERVKTTTIFRTLYLNPVEDNLHLSLEGNQQSDREFDLHKLKKIEKIPHNWLWKHGLQFIFEDEILEIKQLSLEDCNRIKLSIRAILREDDAHQIDFENNSGNDVKSSKS